MEEQSYDPICTCEGGEPQGFRKERPRYPLEGTILEIDVTAYFDSIVREQLMEMIEKTASRTGNTNGTRSECRIQRSERDHVSDRVELSLCILLGATGSGWRSSG
jgi:hypothetical protein